ncbi:MAG TPA: hypothetical protein VFA15_03165, partial [Nitrososphaera sp.]|nr:hypothetical protein [Nitrososphaera sp.]
DDFTVAADAAFCVRCRYSVAEDTLVVYNRFAGPGCPDAKVDRVKAGNTEVLVARGTRMILFTLAAHFADR